MSGINGINFAALNAMQQTAKTQATDKTNGAIPIGQNKAADNTGFYPGLNFSPEARMAAEMEKSPFMQKLNDLLGV